jgi:uncharacterized cupin superfamily protein
LHHNEDEWFYAIEGEYIVEVGSERFRLKSGDSILGPREVPHVWAFVGDTPGKMLIVSLAPANKMEAFFREGMSGTTMHSSSANANDKEFFALTVWNYLAPTIRGMRNAARRAHHWSRCPAT